MYITMVRGAISKQKKGVEQRLKSQWFSSKAESIHCIQCSMWQLSPMIFCSPNNGTSTTWGSYEESFFFWWVGLLSKPK